MFVSLHRDELVAREILVGDVPGVLARAGAAADLETTALPERVEREAAMTADDVAGVGDDVTGRRRDVAREEFAERPFADEADAGAVRLVEDRQPGLARERAHFGLREFA